MISFKSVNNSHAFSNFNTTQEILNHDKLT